MKRIPTFEQIKTFGYYLFIALLGGWLMYNEFGVIGAVVGFVVAVPVAIVLGVAGILMAARIH